jgi:hypothetical protein
VRRGKARAATLQRAGSRFQLAKQDTREQGLLSRPGSKIREDIGDLFICSQIERVPTIRLFSGFFEAKFVKK